MGILTQYQKDKYLENPFHCPFCDSGSISADEFEPTATSVYREVECIDCKEKWDEEFELSNVTTQEERES